MAKDKGSDVRRGRLQARWDALLAAYSGVMDKRQDHKRILESLVWVTLLLVVAKLVGAAREVAVAWKYGVSPIADAFSLLVSTVGLPVSIWNSLLMIAVLPLYIKLAGQGTSHDLKQFRRESLGLTLVLGVALGGGVFLWVSHLLEGNTLGLAPGPLSMARWMVGPLTLIVPLGMVNYLLSAQLMARGGVVNSLLEGTPALITLGAVLIFSALTPAPLVWGMVAGTLLQLIVLILVRDRRDSIEWPSFRFRSTVWRVLLGGVFWIAVSQIVLSFVDVIDQVMIVSAGPGANAELGYGNRMLALPLTLGVTGIIRALLPALADIRSRGAEESYVRRIAARWAQVAFWGGCVGLAFGWILAPWLVSAFYQHGAFTAKNTSAVVDIIRAGLVRMPVYFGGVVVAQFIVSKADYSVYVYMAGINLVNIIIKVVANYFLIKLMGAPGAMISTAIMYAVSTGGLLVLANKIHHPRGATVTTPDDGSEKIRPDSIA